MFKASLDMIASLSNKTIKGFATDQIINQTLSYSSALGFDPFTDQIKSLTQNPKTFESIEESLEKWGHLAKGKTAPNFEGLTLDGKKV